MTQLTKEQIQFIISALSEINLSVTNPNALMIVRNTQDSINTLKKMLVELESEEGVKTE